MRRLKDASRVRNRARLCSSHRCLDMGNPAVDKNEIDRSVADDLIGDMKVAAPRVSRFGNHHTYDEYRRVSAITLPCSDSVVWDHFQARGRQNRSSTWCRTSQKQIRTK